MSLMFDSHSHVNAPQFDADRGEVLARMREAGMLGALVVACDKADLERTTPLLEENPGFLVGAWALHPEYAVPTEEEPSVEEIVRINSAPSMVAVGETGLDYYWCKDKPLWQTERFIRHIEAAKILGKPLVIHARDAETEALEILARHDAGEVGFVMHCFSGSLEDALRTVEIGGHVSFTGSITFKRNDELREISRAVPLERLLLETDCPYMAPVPFRGKRCEPVMVREIAQCHADLRGLKAADVIEQTGENARALFHLDF